MIYTTMVYQFTKEMIEEKLSSLGFIKIGNDSGYTAWVNQGVTELTLGTINESYYKKIGEKLTFSSTDIFSLDSDVILTGTFDHWDGYRLEPFKIPEDGVKIRQSNIYSGNGIDNEVDKFIVTKIMVGIEPNLISTTYCFDEHMDITFDEYLAFKNIKWDVLTISDIDLLKKFVGTIVPNQI
jgi:hypothetical protein